MTGRALNGIRVVDLSTGVSGPYCTKLLAGLGADVLKLEPPDGDPTRRRGPFPDDVPHPEKSGMFLHLNTGKRSAIVDPATESDRDTVLALARSADVLVESFPPGRMESLGLGFETLHAANPRLVVVSITPFGQDGPYRDFQATEIVTYALSGYMMLTGDPDREPLKAYGDQTELQGGQQGATATMVALFARDLTGEGQHVDVSVCEAGSFLLGGVPQAYAFRGMRIRRAGARLMGMPDRAFYPSTLRPCKDGYVHAHTNQRHPDLMAVLMEEPRLADPEILSAPMGHADEIDALMAPWLERHDKWEVVRRAQELRLPFTEVMTPAEVFADEAHRERGFWAEVEHPAAGRITQAGSPIRMTATPWVTERAPLLGEHTNEAQSEAAMAPAKEQRSERPVSGRTPKPLEGVRVLELTNAVAGPIAGFILGDMGAEVIRVEAPTGRHVLAPADRPPVEGAPDRPWNRLGLMNELNRSKRGITLDLTKPEGREIFLGIAAKSDLVIENFAPRVMKNLGIDYPDLAKVKQDIILVSMPAFGKSGKYGTRISYGPGIDAMSGLSHLTGYADGPPSKPGNFYCDQNAGLLAAFSALAALWHRRRTGEGQYVELPMIEGELQLVAEAFLDYVLNGRVQTRIGNRHPTMAPHGVYACRGEDRWVAIACRDDRDFGALCEVMGRKDLATVERFRDGPSRKRHEEELDAAISAWTRDLDHYDAMQRLQAVGVPAGAALDCVEMFDDPHMKARGQFEWVRHPELGDSPHTRVAWKLRGTPSPVTVSAPVFGQDNDDVLEAMLGMSRETIASLYELGVVASEPPMTATH